MLNPYKMVFTSKRTPPGFPQKSIFRIPNTGTPPFNRPTIKGSCSLESTLKILKKPPKKDQNLIFLTFQILQKYNESILLQIKAVGINCDNLPTLGYNTIF